jgi:hypothetical protein
MKKIFKIISIIIFSIVLFLVATYLYITDFGSKDILSNDPRKPKYEIPITYNISWWSNQENLIIDSLKIEIIESKLNLFNSKSLVSYSVYGKMKIEKFWKPKIEEIHISERIENDSLKSRIIEITPIIKMIENEKENEGVEKFNFKNEHTITSNSWGDNKIRFICINKEQSIKLIQYK